MILPCLIASARLGTIEAALADAAKAALLLIHERRVTWAISIRSFLDIPSRLQLVTDDTIIASSKSANSSRESLASSHNSVHCRKVSHSLDPDHIIKRKFKMAVEKAEIVKVRSDDLRHAYGPPKIENRDGISIAE
jgi:hypothetical protein